MSGNAKHDWPSKIRNYEIGDELGHGAFSHVCKGFNTSNKTQYAIKIFPKANLTDNGDTERFQREINTMAFLRHENLVALYDFFSDEKNFYLIIDLCPGGELFDYIVDHDKLDEPTAAIVFQQIVDAIAYCHSFGVAHRDLKPENVLIQKFPHVKVADFGLCGFISDQQMMKTFCGSPCYCSPECLCRIQYDGRKSDIWSLGVILYAMVTGEHPWNISNTSVMLRQILKGAYTVPSFISSQCKDLICSMMKVNPADRITIEKIVKHPWLKVGQKAPIKGTVVPGKISLPPLQVRTVQEISMESARSSQRSESGIVNPFVNSSEDEKNDGGEGGIQLSSLPKLCVRSASVENVLASVNGGKQNLKESGRRRLVPTGGISMSQTRQRSAVNLLMPKKAASKPKNAMMTIAEDDN
ncbi:hypothetical protein M9Y10_017849 [Tritrichomonas musculus]|uniref:Protein kinase domain-containing protein n=1 Tax=Tritrichomonas musculus TaxID=1915356 RepID=A0ABR2HV24_9EUKA